MKYFYLSILLSLLFSCNKQVPKNSSASKESQKVINSEFQQIIDSARVEGVLLIYDPQEEIYYSNDFQRVEKGNLPASTFKIPNSIIALETGVVENDSTLFKWDGQKRRLSIWEKDMIFRDAFHLSCVPCYQDIARRVGEKRMNSFLTKLNYGDMIVDSSNIDLFWLEGDSKITPSQQIDFLYRFYHSKLPISQRTEEIMKRLMVVEETDNRKISGKTGWSIRNGNNNGWFVGYVETKEKVFFFAANVEPQEAFNMELFPMIRKKIVFKALEVLEIG